MDIDRSEVVEHIFVWQDGTLVHEKAHWKIPDWSQKEKTAMVERFEQHYDRRAIAVGAFHHSAMVGLVKIMPLGLAERPGTYELGHIVESHRYRNRGIGTTLIEMAIKNAIESGATSLCVLSTPVERAIQFSVSVGFTPDDVPELDVFAWWDGEDIYLEMPLTKSMRETKQRHEEHETSIDRLKT